MVRRFKTDGRERGPWGRALCSPGVSIEWSNSGKEPSAEASKAIEPWKDCGTQDLDLLRTEAARFKSDGP